MKLAIIGGSSLTTFDAKGVFGSIGLEVASNEDVSWTNAYGSGIVKKFVLAGGGMDHILYFMQRHSHGGTGGIESGITPPHAINYHANMRALADLGVDAVVATTSCGTIVPCFPPGRVGVVKQYIDFTGKATTYHHDDAKFTSVTKPYDTNINRRLVRVLRDVQDLDEDVQLEFVLWLSVGPQYETTAEVDAISRLGGEICGMTSPYEAKLCAELALPYSCLCVSSNWAAGRTPGDPSKRLHHAEVSETSRSTSNTIIACITAMLATPSPTPQSSPIQHKLGGYTEPKYDKL